jgi:hypothetical protein
MEIDLPKQRILHDTGYLDASQGALDDLARAMQLEKAWGDTADGRRVVRHPAEIAAEQRATNEAYEASILSAPDPRPTLQAALRLQHEADDEIARVGAQLARAEELVIHLEEQVGVQQGAIAAGEASAVERLLNTLAAGSGTSPEPSLPAVDANALAAATASLRVAQEARDRLQRDRTAASNLAAQRRHGTARISVQVFRHDALEMAHAILVDQAALDQRKADLAALVRVVVSEDQRLNRAPSPVPSAFHQAGAYSADPKNATVDWVSAYQRLCAEGPDEGSRPRSHSSVYDDGLTPAS